MDEAPKEKENLLKRLFFNRDRLGAFMDAILAIIMTILVLELEKPSAPTLAAFASLCLDQHPAAVLGFLPSLYHQPCAKLGGIPGCTGCLRWHRTAYNAAFVLALSFSEQRQ